VNSLLFILGLTITFTLLGFIAGLMGRMVGDVGNFWPYLVAGVCLVMGLHLLDLLKFDIPLITNVERNDSGTPLVSSIFALAREASSSPFLLM
jgi:cytochrome c-type biogenesis protein